MVGGRYRLEGRVGEGATSDVYLALDLAARRAVVVKQLSVKGSESAEMRARFLREARAVSLIDHPSVVRVFDFGAPEDERPYLVMEALVGEPLSDLMARQGAFSPDLALVLCRHAAAGLAAAHLEGVIHRDIKPDNLFLVGPLGDPYGLKLIDFGMAKLAVSRGTSGSHLILGTMQYMAPEQIMVDPIDARTDVYGLGVVMFRLFTGHLPFDAVDSDVLLSHQLFSTMPPPSWLAEAIDPRIEAVIMRATRKHPDNRYPSMEALLLDLDRLVGFRGVATDELHHPPLAVTPDAYDPKNPEGRKVAQMLARRFGTVPPPSVSPWE